MIRIAPPSSPRPSTPPPQPANPSHPAPSGPANPPAPRASWLARALCAGHVTSDPWQTACSLSYIGLLGLYITGPVLGSVL